MSPKRTTPNPQAPRPATPPETPIPPDVQEKLAKARKAVAEAIAAAEAAGLVKTTVDPPPILDILITGRANDEAALKAITKENIEAGISLEAFGAWFTGFGKMEGISAEKNVRILPPSKGLAEFFRTRATIMNPLLEEARKPYAAKKAEEGQESGRGEKSR